jgi:hypothetical protein
MITVYGLNKLGFTNIDDFILQDDGDGTFIKEWDSDQPQPSEEDITTAHNEWQAEWDAQEYARNRKTEYDALNQFEMQFDDKEDGTTTWEDAIAAIKTKYPKG